MRFSAGCVGETRVINIPGNMGVANQGLGGRVALEYQSPYYCTEEREYLILSCTTTYTIHTPIQYTMDQEQISLEEVRLSSFSCVLITR